MITITRGNQNINKLEKFTFQLTYMDGTNMNVFVEAENIIAAWDGIFKQENLVLGILENPVIKIEWLCTGEFLMK